ncbi:MAG: hypothetical protein HC836_16495 [Richelia sp. RM2_1_2]|nr:hypothetical protein [Richelia sp. RM2_1_2]
MINCPLHFVDIKANIARGRAILLLSYINDWIATANFTEWHRISIADTVNHFDTKDLCISAAFVNKDNAIQFEEKFSNNTIANSLHFIDLEDDTISETREPIITEFLNQWLKDCCIAPFYVNVLGFGSSKLSAYANNKHIKITIGFVSEDDAIQFKLAWC